MAKSPQRGQDGCRGKSPYRKRTAPAGDKEQVEAHTLKSVARSMVGKVAWATGRIQKCERAARDAVTVLCYHRVLPDDQRRAYHDPDLVVTPETLRAHCRVLAERYCVVTLGSALAPDTTAFDRGKPVAVITFDDGYRDNILHAAPILREVGLVATFFVIAGLVDTERQPWYDLAGGALQALQRSGRSRTSPKEAVAHAKTLSPAERQEWLADLLRASGPIQPRNEDLIMTSAQLRDLVAAGHEVGSHSMTHPLLPQCTDEELEVELSASRELLGKLVGKSIDTFCYPNGDWDERVVAAARKAGYICATSLRPGLNRRGEIAPFDVKRWFIDQGRLASPSGKPSDELLRMKICGLVT